MNDRSRGQTHAEGTRVGIMQPYFFPYIGYFQLISTCDVFVFLDDAQYIKQGWVNRNRIQVNGKAQWMTLSVAAGDHQLPINRREYQMARLGPQIVRRIEAAYRRAPRFLQVMPMIREIMAFPDTNVARFNIHALRRLCEHLGIRTAMRVASEIRTAGELRCEHMVIDLCRRLGAAMYINPVAGAPLYPASAFAAAGITLKFLVPGLPEYAPHGPGREERLSIVDVLMHNEPDAVHDMLKQSILIDSPVA